MFGDNALYLGACPSDAIGRFLAARFDLLLPELALIIVVERKRRNYFFNLLCARCCPHCHGCGNKNEMIVAMNESLQLNPFEIPTPLDPIPISDRLPDGFLSLNPVMPDLARNNSAGIGDFMPGANSHKRTAGNAIGSLEQDRTRAAFTEKSLHIIRHIVQIILRSAAFQTGVLCLRDVHWL